MPTFLKKHTKPGKYIVNRLDGTKGEETFTADQLREVATNFDLIRNESGRLPPAPWKHDGSRPITKEELANSKNNAGFVKDCFYDEEAQELVSTLEVPLQEDAKRVGKSVREVSPLILGSWTDPTTKKNYKNVMGHLALVTQPVEGNQSNFIPIDFQPAAADEFAIAMSAYLGPVEESSKEVGAGTGATKEKNAGENDVQSVSACIEALRKRKIDLPDNTTAENLIERICIACRALDGAETEDESLGDEQQPQPIAMGQNMAELTPDQKKAAKLQELATSSLKATFKSRINALVGKRISKKFADEVLLPLCDGYQLSMNDAGKTVVQELEIRLDTLEKMAPAASGGQEFFAPGEQGSALGQYDNAEGEALPEYGRGELIGDEDPEALDKLVQAQIAASNY